MPVASRKQKQKQKQNTSFKCLRGKNLVRDCPLKKMHNLKFENYALFSGHAEDLSLEDSLSYSSEGLFQRGNGGARIYRSFCKNKKTKIKTNKKK